MGRGKAAAMSIVPANHIPIAAPLHGAAADLLVPADAPLAAVLAALELPAADAAIGDGDINDALRASASSSLVAGGSVGRLGHKDERSDADYALEVSVVAGLASGATERLGPGAHRLASGEVIQVLASPARDTWEASAGLIESLRGSTGPTASGGGSPPSVLALSPPIDLEPSRGDVFRRPPRALIEDPATPIASPELPPAPAPPTPFSWASLLAPLPIALAMAFFFRPIFALFGLMGPVLVVGRWFEQRRSRRKQIAAREQAIAAAHERIMSERRAQAEAFARDAWKRYPHLAHLGQRALARSVRVWERRSTDDDRATVVVGVGPRQVDPVCEPPPRDLADVATAALRLRPVPHVLNLVSEGGLGLHGDLAAGRSVLRSILLQLTTLRGPADLSVVVIGSDLGHWEWTKWLPHVQGPLLAEPGNADRWQPLAGRAAVVIVDDPHADVAAVVRAAESADVELTVLSVAAASGELPAACTRAIPVDVDGWIETGGEPAGVEATLAAGITLDRATEWAKSLACIEDPEQSQREADSRLTAPTLPQALEISGSLDVLAARSRTTPTGQPSAELPFVLGADIDGLARFDLVADGPHALIAGTTGSGKSELLRTLVLSLAAGLSSEHLSFVLIDFKGGGAFDGCADLPHVAGLITDLDETLVERALAGLRHEVRRREEQVRAGEPLIPLVVVIDEFAVLASDYPDVLDGLVDLAARGRSLRMHLILATQKPSGVVDHRIRANTNLRIALRVQHAHESHDVVGVGDAAELDRRCPGRAVVRVGSDDVRTLQVCRTLPPSTAGSAGVLLAPFVLRPTTDSADTGLHVDGEMPLDQLASWIAQVDGGVAAPMWEPPLSARCTHEHLRDFASGSETSSGYVLGIGDRPDVREQHPFGWDPARGGLVVFSGDSDPVEHLVGGLVAAVIAGTGSIEHAYVISARPEPSWEAHACVGASIAATDRERIERLLALVEQRCAQSMVNDESGLLLAITDIGSVLAGFDDLERLELIERLEAVARTGAAAGVHLVLGARSIRDLPHRVAHHIPNRLLGRVADPTAHLLLGTTAPSTASPMHVIDVESGCLVLIADQPAADAIEVGNHSVAAPIERCPEAMESAHVAEPAAVPGGIDLAIGVRYQDLAPAVLPIRWGRDVLVAGPPGSGRSRALELIGELSRRCEVQVCAVGGGDLATLPNIDSSEPTVILVDDVERLSSELAQGLTALLAATDRQVSVVVASTIDGARAPRSLAATVRANGVGLLMGGSPLDGEIFRLRRPELPGLGRICGRATLVVHGKADSIHVAISAGTA